MGSCTSGCSTATTMYSSYIHCPICFTDNKPSECRVIHPCGHIYCVECLDQVLSRHTRNSPAVCPACRKKIKRTDLSPLFPDLVCKDDREDKVGAVVEGLGKMDGSTPLVSVQGAARRLKRLAEELDPEGDRMVASIMQAVHDFNTRIIPEFAKMQQQSDEIAALKSHHEEEMKQGRKAIRRVTALESDLSKAQSDLASIGNEYDTALDAAQASSEEVQLLRREVKRLTDDNDEKRDRIETQRGQLQDHAAKQIKQKEKIYTLRKEISELKSQLKKQQAELDAADMADLTIVESVEERENDDPFAGSPLPHKKYRDVDTPPMSSPRTVVRHAMPKPGFSSDWSLPNPKQKKRKLDTGLPLALDHMGRPLKPIQIGSRQSMR